MCPDVRICPLVWKQDVLHESWPISFLTHVVGLLGEWNKIKAQKCTPTYVSTHIWFHERYCCKAYCMSHWMSFDCISPFHVGRAIMFRWSNIQFYKLKFHFQEKYFHFHFLSFFFLFLYWLSLVNKTELGVGSKLRFDITSIIGQSDQKFCNWDRNYDRPHSTKAARKGSWVENWSRLAEILISRRWRCCSDQIALY